MHILQLVALTNGSFGLTPEALQRLLGSREVLPTAASTALSDLVPSKNGLFQVIYFDEAEYQGHPGKRFLLVEMTDGVGKVLTCGHAHWLHRTIMAPEVVSFRGYSADVGYFDFVCQNKFAITRKDMATESVHA